MKKYRKKRPSRWHHMVSWAIQKAIGNAVACGETDMRNERFIQRGRLLRRDAWDRCADTRHDWDRGNQ